MLASLKKIIAESLSELESEHKCLKILGSLQLIAKTFIEIESTVKQVQGFAADYDLDTQTPGNGFRSFIYIVDKVAEKIEKTVVNIKKYRHKILFRRKFYEKYVT